MAKIQMTIRGKVPSKANSYKVITFNGHGSLGKTERLKAYEHSFFLQCPHRGVNLYHFFTLYADVFYETMNPDLDNSLKIILDCLQMCEVIKNDNKCVQIIARKFVDKSNPRVEITIDENLVV